MSETAGTHLETTLSLAHTYLASGAESLMSRDPGIETASNNRNTVRRKTLTSFGGLFEVYDCSFSRNLEP